MTRPQNFPPTGDPAVATEYIVVLQRVSGPGFTMVLSSDLIRFATRAEADSHGWRTEDSDDFNIGTVADGRLIAFGWGANDFGPDGNGDPHGGYDLEEISREIGLGGNLCEVALHGVCAFCDIVAGVEPATIVREWQNAIAIVPLNPVVPGHLLVIPRVHVQDFTTDPQVSAGVMWAAAELAVPPANVITSAGREATQSVFHLHLHIVPRAENDGLALPWYSGRTSKRGTDV